jgi:hypothetical protein
MPFVAAKASVFKLDNAAGTLTDISAYVDSVSGIANTTDMLETTTLLGATSTSTFEYHPAGTTAGTPKVSGECLVSNYEVSSSVADLVTFTVSLQITGNVTWGTN